MKIKKGQLVKVDHSRKGSFNAIADNNFDTEIEKFYPLSLAQENSVAGMAQNGPKVILCHVEAHFVISQ